MNRKYRKIDRATDVLSFNLNDEDDLGEIVISEKWAKVNGERLVVHGLLHLLGYDHTTAKERELMRSKEEVYLK